MTNYVPSLLMEEWGKHKVLSIIHHAKPYKL